MEWWSVLLIVLVLVALVGLLLWISPQHERRDDNPSIDDMKRRAERGFDGHGYIG